jgi:branched-chain amino acid transport system ATP-binding protein
MLTVEALSVRYGPIKAVREVDFTCAAGEVVAVVGPNGAGKSSILNAIAGALRSGVSGRVFLDGRPLVGLVPERVLRAGVALVPEGRRILASLTVYENLQLAMSVRRDRAEARNDLSELLERFPVLDARRVQRAGTLSGGEQQQLAIARAMLSRPKVLLLDEPSLGLAPVVVNEVFDALTQLRAREISIVLVEQMALRAIDFADRGFLLRHGNIEATTGGLSGDAMIAAYLDYEVGVASDPGSS